MKEREAVTSLLVSMDTRQVVTATHGDVRHADRGISGALGGSLAAA